MADGFRIVPFAHRRVEPGSGIFTSRFSRKRQAPLTPVAGEESFVQLGKIANAANTQAWSEASVLLPTPGIFRTSRPARNRASWPGTMYSTPFGFA